MPKESTGKTRAYTGEEMALIQMQVRMKKDEVERRRAAHGGKLPRGRSPKRKAEPASSDDSASEDDDDEEDVPKRPAKKPGRPRKRADGEDLYRPPQKKRKQDEE